MSTRIRRALLSVAEKRGVEDLGRRLAALGVEILSTGGTARALREAGVPVTDVSAATGAEEILEGRVKTLHPVVHGGILARRDHPGDMATLAAKGIPAIDLVAVNLYPFEERPSLEEIDIGGPAMVRAAAKNCAGVVVLIRPEDYGPTLAELEASGDCSPETRRRLAATAFARIAEYDIAIAAFFARELRYGENPHQRGALVGDGPGRVLSGKEVSYNNLLDIDAALGLVRDLEGPAAACVVKHASPCGAASCDTAEAAFLAAYAGDPLSAFGGIVALSVPCDAAAARAMTEPDRFLECVAAPAFSSEAKEVLTTRPRWGKNVRLIETEGVRPPSRLVRSVAGGLLVQTPDQHPVAEETLERATVRTPTPAEDRDLRMAIACAKHVRSNAIAVVAGGALVGQGGGQTSRVDAVRIALERAGGRAKGACLASDAFFPFPDSLELAAKAGISCVVAPRGSRKDAEVKAAAAALGLAFCFTDLRHFRH